MTEQMFWRKVCKDIIVFIKLNGPLTKYEFDQMVEAIKIYRGEK